MYNGAYGNRDNYGYMSHSFDHLLFKQAKTNQEDIDKFLLALKQFRDRERSEITNSIRSVIEYDLVVPRISIFQYEPAVSKFQFQYELIL